VISYRGFTPKLKTINDFSYNNRGNIINNYLYNFPTGNGGILYTPSFFHNSSELLFNKEIYLHFCPTADDIWFYLIRLINNVSCYIDNKPYLIKCLTNQYGLFVNYNSNSNTNTLLNVVSVLHKDNYISKNL
jgi:hypothetical protein